MVFPTILSKLLEWLISHLLGHSKMRNYGFHNYTLFYKNSSNNNSRDSTDTKSCQEAILSPHSEADLNNFPYLPRNPNFLKPSSCMVFDINGTLFKPQHNFFPYFMLVAFEGGSIIRAFILLLSCPISWLLDNDSQIRVMIFITFCGLKLRDMASVERTVLPKFFLEEMNYNVYQAINKARVKLVFTSVPRVMVEGFVREYLKVDNVVGTELHSVGNYFTGLLDGGGLLVKYKALKGYFGDKIPDIGIGNLNHLDHLFLHACKESYVVNPQEDDKMPREKYPKPLIFHDGRLAFLPTPTSSLTMFMWLPFGIILAIFRLFVGIALPYKLALLLGTFSGVTLRTRGITPATSTTTTSGADPRVKNKGVLYVCTHRTLLDPVMLGVCLAKPLTAVTYSLSRTSEIIAPLRTVRLTRDRKTDSETMERLLKEGDLVVCPEGTTCREPYLLRFSSLFAELADEIVPVAVNVKVSMFYGTTASGLKMLDPIFFLMNPRPKYYIHVLGKSPIEETCAGGKSSCHVANQIQRQLADALGFECTNLTRKDKYLMLAGNEGRVGP